MSTQQKRARSNFDYNTPQKLYHYLRENLPLKTDDYEMTISIKKHSPWTKVKVALRALKEGNNNIDHSEIWHSFDTDKQLEENCTRIFTRCIFGKEEAPSTRSASPG